jgi:glycerophosphoryl diester phosphodiesterase
MTIKTNRLDWMKQIPIAHRGLHDKKAGRYENTLSAAQAAMAQGYSIELDLHPSRDLVPMVFHDDELDRLTDKTGPFRVHDAKSLQTIHIGGTQDHVPTLKELLDLVAGKVGLVIELKGIAGEDDGFVAAVLEALKDYHGPVALMSFNHWLLQDARALGCKIPLGLTAEGKDQLYDLHWQIVRELDLEFVSYGISDLPNRFVSEFRDCGKPVICWTIRSKEQAELSKQYCDQITFEGFLA